MEMIIDFKSEKGINNINLLDLKGLDLMLTNNKNVKEFKTMVEKTLLSSADYIIKAMPVSDGIKDILIDVKNSLKTKDIKKVVSTAVNSSIREGLELLGTPVSAIKDIIKVKDVALKGGLREALVCAMDIVSKKYTKNNLFASNIIDFFSKTKDFVSNNDFLRKIDQKIGIVTKRKEEFLTACNNWYKTYEDLDFNSTKKMSSNIKEMSKKVLFDEECMKESKIIENMSMIIENKKTKLSFAELQLCKTL